MPKSPRHWTSRSRRSAIFASACVPEAEIAVLTDKRQERRRQVLTDGQAAHLIAITCSKVPDGHDHWRVRMLAGKAVELGYVRRISPETVRQLLKKTP
jgi:hypothetical protein